VETRYAPMQLLARTRSGTSRATRSCPSHYLRGLHKLTIWIRGTNLSTLAWKSWTGTTRALVVAITVEPPPSRAIHKLTLLIRGTNLSTLVPPTTNRVYPHSGLRRSFELPRIGKELCSNNPMSLRIAYRRVIGRIHYWTVHEALLYCGVW